MLIIIVFICHTGNGISIQIIGYNIACNLVEYFDTVSALNHHSIAYMLYTICTAYYDLKNKIISCHSELTHADHDRCRIGSSVYSCVN